MKKFIAVVLVVSLLAVCLTACGGSASVDYEDAASFEAALNNGEDLTGKTVKITVNKFVPDSAFGYNIQTGEHLNFCSSKNPGVKEGDTVTVKATEITSMLGSYIITFDLVK